MDLQIPELRAQAEAFARRACAALEGRTRSVASLGADHTVSWRIKTEKAIREKAYAAIQRGDQPNINDLVGVRVLAVHSGHFSSLLEELRLWAQEHELLQVKFENKYLAPGLGGYRAIHLDYAPREGGVQQLRKDMTVEVQLMTWSHRLHAELCHALLYKCSLPHNPAISSILESMAHAADRIDTLAAEALSGAHIANEP